MTTNSLKFLHIWGIAIRPKTLPAALAPVLIGGMLALRNQPVSWITFLAILFCALLIQVATNLANDVIDFERGADSASRLGQTRVTQAGLLSAQSVKLATALALFLALLIGIYLVNLGGWPILIIGLLSLVCAIGYSAGPFALAYNGLGDLFVLIFFGPVAVGGTYYLLTQAITYQVLIAGIAPGMIATAIIVVNNLRDIETDRLSNKRTLAVRFGRKFAQAEYLSLLCVAAIIPLVLVYFSAVPTLCAIAALYFIPALQVNKIVQQKQGKELNLALEQTGKLLLLYSLLFVVGLF